MSLDDAAAYALQVKPHPASPTSAPPGAAAPRAALTARESQVVHLISKGLTNQQIADELVLSVRTVERHAENIYAKLGLHGKAARAALAAAAQRETLASAR
jgi:DNA-binding NarL/FixJ family response regulator